MFSNKTRIGRLCKIIIPAGLIWGNTVPSPALGDPYVVYSNLKKWKNKIQKRDTMQLFSADPGHYNVICFALVNMLLLKRHWKFFIIDNWNKVDYFRKICIVVLNTVPHRIELTKRPWNTVRWQLKTQLQAIKNLHLKKDISKLKLWW